MYGTQTLAPGSTLAGGSGSSKTIIALETSAGGAALVVKAPHTTASADLPGWMAAKPTTTAQAKESDVVVNGHHFQGATLAADSTGFATVTSAVDAVAAKASASARAHVYEPSGSGASEVVTLTGWGCAVFGVIFGAFVLL